MKDAGKGHKLLSENVLSGVHGGRADGTVEESAMCLVCGWTASTSDGNINSLMKQHTAETGHDDFMVTAAASI